MQIGSVRVRGLAMTALASTCIAALAAPAYAQEGGNTAPEEAAAQEANTGADSTEIVVTAERRAGRLQDTPISITALTAVGLEKRGISNLRQISAYTPNVELTTTSRPTGGGSAFAAFFRGVGSGDYTFPTDPTIGLYVDGVYLARPLGGLMSLADITRVEVLRGPQGTLYGRNTLGGAISLVTASPNLTGGVTGEAMIRAGSYGRIDATASINTPLVEDRVGFKLSVANFTSDGYLNMPYAKTKGFDENRLIIRAGLLFQLGPDLTLDLRGDYSRQRQTGAGSTNQSFSATLPTNVVRFNTLVAPLQNAQFGLPAGSTYGASWISNDPYTTFSGGPVRDDFEIYGASATIEYKPSPELNLRSITAYRNLRTNVSVDSDGSPYLISVIDEDTRDETFSQELHVYGKLFDERLSYLVGAYYFKETGTVDKESQSFHGLYQVTGLASDARDTSTFLDYEARSLAAFAQFEFNITPKLSLVAGGRYTSDRKTFGVLVTLPERGGVVSVPSQSATNSWDAFTPKFGINYRATSDLLIYASYSSGFKSGGFSPPTATVAISSYTPEKLKSYELGIKSQWFDRRLTANIALWYSQWKDLQLSVLVPGPTGTNIGVTQNGGDAELYGFEAELSGRITDGLTLSLAAGYTHNKFVRLTAGAITNGFSLATKLPHAPEWTITPAIDYSFDANFARVDLRGSLTYRSDQILTVNDPLSAQPGYTLVNARIAVSPKAAPGLELAVEGNNLTNKVYYAYSQRLGTTTARTRITGEPRTIAFTARYKF